jgi:SAM-dependent methyltransferase
MKVYDRAYFDRWYRAGGAVVRPEATARKAKLALAAAEHLLGGEVRNVLDVGCGEAPWRAILKRARPGLRYLGLDTSSYVIRRHGKRRDIRYGHIAALDELQLNERFDLVVCSDMLQYVPTPELRAGLRQIRGLTGGLAFIEAFTSHDDMIGDGDGWIHRTAGFYRRELRDAGFIACGMHCYLPGSLRPSANELELLPGG